MRDSENKENKHEVTRPKPVSGRVISLNMGAEIDACFNDAPPPCQAVCPFGLDVCAFAERVSSGRFSSAYRMLSEKLLFPEIVHELCERPCEGICLRGDIDGPIRIGQLEKAAIEFGAEPPKRYSIPEQGKSVAVACGGLSGAAVALLLGSAGYSVKLFEKDGELSGRLAEGFAAETYLPQIMERLEAAKCEIVTGHEVKDISELDGYDAVVLPVGGADGSGVTGGVGGLCGNGGMGGVDRADGRNGVGGADVGERVFFCGIGDDEPGALAVVRAMEVASQIQGWLKTGVRFAGDGQERHAAGSGGGVGACGSGSGEAGGSECGVGAGGSGSGGSGSGSGEAAGGVYLSEDSGLDGKRLDVLKAIYKDTPPSERTGDTPFSRESAAAEAKLCMSCRCDACKEVCEFMRHYGMMPKTIRNNVRMNLNPMEGLKAHVATRMIFSCSACGLCKEACSEDIDTGSLLLFARSLMQRESEVPPVFHEFWLRDMEHADSPAASLLRHAVGRQKSTHLFFSGCQLGAADPDLVRRAYDTLLATMPETGIYLGCCGAPALWSGREDLLDASIARIREAWESFGRPVFVLACPSCRRVFTSRLPEIETVSLYSVLLKTDAGRPDSDSGMGAGANPCADAAFALGACSAASGGQSEGAAAAGENVYAVFDPCAAHSDGATKKAVRELIAASGHVYAELPSGGGSGCCGFGGLPYPANPELAAKLGALRTSASELPYVTYCVNCRDVFRRNGKECRHVLELALPDESGQHAELGNAVTAPSLSERRAGRERLRRLLLSELWKENTPMDMVNDGLPEIEYAEGLRAKMDTLLLLDSDVAAVIERAERESAQLVNQETGHYTAHGRVGEITCWVTYRRDGEGFFVENVYCHRMRISGE